MGFSPDAVAMALSLGLESMEDAIQWCIDHPDAVGATRPTPDVRDEQEALLHYALAESISTKVGITTSRRTRSDSCPERPRSPSSTKAAGNGARFDEKRFGELREALKRERNAIDRNSISGTRADWVTALNEVDD